jgi:hypothetical protein
MKKVFDRVEVLRQTALAVKEEVERLLLRQLSLSPCPYVRVPLL